MMTSADVINGQIPTVEHESLEPEGIGAISLQQSGEEAEAGQKVAARPANVRRSCSGDERARRPEEEHGGPSNPSTRKREKSSGRTVGSP